MAIIESQYSHGTIIAGPPSRPDMTSEEHAAARKADRIGYRALLVERRWTAEQFAAAKLYNFPKPVTQVLGRDGSSEAMYSRQGVAEWAAALKLFTKLLK